MYVYLKLYDYTTFNILFFYSCDYNKYTISVVKRITNLQKKELKEEIKVESEPMEVDENDVIPM